MTITRTVPCGACTLCCRGGEAIVLHPECGDRVQDYQTREVWNPLFGDGPVHMLEQQPNGDCIYVGPFGCTIHDRRPTICREFDCRDCGLVHKFVPRVRDGSVWIKALRDETETRARRKAMK